jgi:Stage II sporulation protein E (SpoIIE)/PAS fold/GAF domain
LEPATAQMMIGQAFAQSSISVAIFDADLRILWANESAEAPRPGLPAQDWRGRRLGEAMPEIDADVIEESLRRVLATGEAVLDLEVTSGVRGAYVEERYWTCLQFPVSASGADNARVVHVMRDVTERAVNARRVALAELASAHIGKTLDTTRTAEELLDVAVPRLADVAAVDLLATVIEGDLGQQVRHERLALRRVAARWPADFPAPADYTRVPVMETNPTSLYHQRLVSGQPTFLPLFGGLSAEQLRQMDFGTGLERMVAAQQAGAHSLIAVPLTARDVIIGVVVMYRLPGSKPFTWTDLSLARDLVSRAALSIDNARLYARERASALALQHGLLPQQVPDVPGVDLCHRYVPAETAAEVGGDWFDVIALRPGRFALIVGDVTGHDIRAASVMGQLRTATATLANLDLTAGQLLSRLDHVCSGLTPDEGTFATCVCAVHDAASGDWEIASAGHPPPALAGPNGQADFLDLPPGHPLGVGGGPYELRRISPPPRSTLVLYTDGLIESPGTDILTGMASLARELSSVSKLDVHEACDALVAALAANPADDVAVLMART